MDPDYQAHLYMQEQLEAFVAAFTERHSSARRHYLPQGEVSKKAAKRSARHRHINPMLGMDGLGRELDIRYCKQLPKGGKQHDIEFVLKAIAKYKLKVCYIMSPMVGYHQQTMPIEEALDAIVGTCSTTIISFIRGKVAYFEGHSIGERFLCIKEDRAY
ncbi:hypothetical protein KBK19_17860 [Microvirga sp. STR05]|uniref:Uncharacterized protein n=1 Tax=Hymenobacter duratus TaxID=2771356 RepID=A0ABR8JLZ8_9BACT|nr:hypothetical protein [Hymenobacter duratus]MBD2716915.1 hypothetical protein [Hymenobacter duratus]MBR7951831.1 hypothetical protein [Microvirga sp. STR05]